MITVAIAAFVATNIDDLFLLAGWFVRRTPAANILVGQLVGFSLLVGVSIGLFLLGTNLPHTAIRWLGILPIAIGVKTLLRDYDGGGESPSSWFSVATVTVANGVDNVGVYVPLFLQHRESIPQIIAIFYAGLIVWVIIAKLFERTLALSKSAHRVAHQLAPVVVILVGIIILLGG